MKANVFDVFEDFCELMGEPRLYSRRFENGYNRKSGGDQRYAKAGTPNWIDAGEFLDRVRCNRTYRDKYGTFANYCRSVWGLSPSHCYRLINGAKTVRLLERHNALTLPPPSSAPQTA